jgi:hypothetical protein
MSQGRSMYSIARLSSWTRLVRRFGTFHAAGL